MNSPTCPAPTASRAIFICRVKAKTFMLLTSARLSEMVRTVTGFTPVAAGRKRSVRCRLSQASQADDSIFLSQRKDSTDYRKEIARSELLGTGQFIVLLR